MDLSLGFVDTLVVTGVMHEADDAYSIRRTCLCPYLTHSRILVAFVVVTHGFANLICRYSSCNRCHA